MTDEEFSQGVEKMIAQMDTRPTLGIVAIHESFARELLRRAAPYATYRAALKDVVDYCSKDPNFHTVCDIAREALDG